ncbi:MAG: hypothetical protein AUK34_08005 [Ignavibacteria bacterium CG2_30_36_16]|nr:MAG: hypothetical protein AUK34_08005 [Ignavibacteria bacterium CG2_30_36_16]
MPVIAPTRFEKFRFNKLYFPGFLYNYNSIESKMILYLTCSIFLIPEKIILKIKSIILLTNL